MGNSEKKCTPDNLITGGVEQVIRGNTIRLKINVMCGNEYCPHPYQSKEVAGPDIEYAKRNAITIACLGCRFSR